MEYYSPIKIIFSTEGKDNQEIQHFVYTTFLNDKMIEMGKRLEKVEGREVSEALYIRKTCRNLVIINNFLYLDSTNANILVVISYYI